MFTMTAQSNSTNSCVSNGDHIKQTICDTSNQTSKITVKQKYIKPPVPPKPLYLKNLGNKFHAKHRPLHSTKNYTKPTYVVTKTSLTQSRFTLESEIPRRNNQLHYRGEQTNKKRYKTLYLYDQLEDAFKALSIKVADSMREDFASSGDESEDINSDEFEHQWLDPLEKDHLNAIDADRQSVLDSSTDLPSPTDYTPKIFAESIAQVNNGETSEHDGQESPVNETAGQKAFQVAQEIYTSEISYLDNLRLLNVQFRKFVIDKGAVSIGKIERKRDSTSSTIAENTLDHILYTLPNLQTLSEEILKGFKERIEHWHGKSKIADVLIEKAPYLKLFVTYIKDLQKKTHLLDRCAQRHFYFGQCLKEFESAPECMKIPICKHMLVPLQRVVKYKELLKQYLKYSPEGTEDHADAHEALSIVLEVAEDSNEAIKKWENTNRLLSLQDRLNGINISESQDNVSSGPLTHVLVEPGRTLIKDGPLMKINRSSTKAVYLILLSDVLLYTSEYQPGNKMSQLKLIDRLPLEGMRIEIPKAAEFQNEFSIISTTRSFALQTSSPKERDEWIRSLVDAVDDNAVRRSSLQLPSTARFEVPSDAILGKQAPVWIPDNRVTMCQGCTAEFTFTFRRHHCRACGKVVCNLCSSFKAPLQYLDYETARVCQKCFDILKEEFESMEEQGERVLEDSIKRSTHRKLKRRFKRGGKEGSMIHLSKKPIRLLECAGGDCKAQMCGYLTHLKDRTWVQRWFVLKNKVLYEYRAPADVCALDGTPVLGYELKTEVTVQTRVSVGLLDGHGFRTKRNFMRALTKSLCCFLPFVEVNHFEGIDMSRAFILFHKNQPPLAFYAESTDLTQQWIDAMKEAIVL